MKLKITLLSLLLILSSITYAKAADSLQVHQNDTTELSREQLVLNFIQEKVIPITISNKVQLIKSGHEKVEDMFEAIRQAQHHIHLQYFKFSHDYIANASSDLIVYKAANG